MSDDELVTQAVKYADALAERRVVASWHAVAAAERFIRDLEDALRPGSRWKFEPELAERAMFFAQQMPNISKRPSTSEFIDWMRILQNDRRLSREFFFGPELILDDELPKYLPILIKSKDDLARLLAR